MTIWLFNFNSQAGKKTWKGLTWKGMAACFVYPWGSHFSASELPRRHLIMFGFNFKSFFVEHHFLLMALLLFLSVDVPTKLEQQTKFPRAFPPGIFRIFSWFNAINRCCDYFYQKKKKNATGADGTFETSSCWCRSTWKAVAVAVFVMGNLFSQRMTRRKGRKKLGGLSTSKKTLEYFKNWKEHISPANTMASWIFGT